MNPIGIRLPERIDKLIRLSINPSAEWRKGMFLRPNCHLMLRAVRVDSPPLTFNGLPLHKALLNARLRTGANQKFMAARLNVSWKTLQNWERGLTRPTRKFWPAIRMLFERE